MEVRTYPHVSFSFVDEPFPSTWKGKLYQVLLNKEVQPTSE